jgi:energy-coupling factor transporter ATP-binding protein EcfA2
MKIYESSFEAAGPSNDPQQKTPLQAPYHDDGDAEEPPKVQEIPSPAPETLETIIARKQQELESLKQKSPADYPPYLTELLNHGHIHLYDHFLQMRALSTPAERRSEIDKTSFSSLSHIVLQAREAIIQKVQNSIPVDKKNILFLLGSTGAGKSTTLCFLRGDKLILKHFQYESQMDQNQLIGHAPIHSCTFLPTIEVVNDLVIVDFPGFSDSHGQLICLGMEYALKALVSRYSPKVLVVEAIINTAGRFASAASLGQRLSRLFENKQECFLGLTKYSQDYHFGQIRRIEADQNNERSNPSLEENDLAVQIELLSRLNMPDQQPRIQGLQQQLSQLQQEREQKQHLPLPDTELKMKSRARLQEIENMLLGAIGLKKLIRFDDLENREHLTSCQGALSGAKDGAIRVNAQHKLDPDEEILLRHRFKNDLMQKIGVQKDCNFEMNEFEDVKKRILESSLINTIFSQTNPEIGQLLHLPETDPCLVKRYDKEVIDSCIEKYTKSVIKEIKILPITNGFKDKIDLFNQNVKKLQVYLLAFSGSRTQDEAAWNKLQREYHLEKDFHLPAWTKALLCISIGNPFELRKLYALDVRKVDQPAFQALIEKSSAELNKIYFTLIRLNGLKNVLENPDELL